MAGYFYFFLASSASILLVSSVDPEVSGSLGTIIGTKNVFEFFGFNYSVHEYHGIPYAIPPVGDRRFTKPELMTTLDSPFYAKTQGSRCPEIGRNDTNEDCLFLDVYVPDQPADDTAGHAVMVWIHGGSFRSGTGNDYHSSLLASYGNIIVVTVNYRLGIFGFFSTGDDNAPGNFGLWDQRLALQWVQKYIGDFGGDKYRVTVAGGSAGAMSSMQFAMNPYNKGLFKRIILQSGTMSTPVMHLERDPLTASLVLMDHLKCNKDSMANLVSCLRGKSVGEIFVAMNATGTVTSFLPVKDGELITTNLNNIEELPINDLEFFRSIDMLSGFNTHDGSVLLLFLFDWKMIEEKKPTWETLTEYLPVAMTSTYGKSYSSELLALVSAQYKNWQTPKDYKSAAVQFTKILGDTNFGVPAVELARLHENATGNFMYYFTPKPPSFHLFFNPDWLNASAAHGEEIPYVFGAINILIGIGDENVWEILLSMKMMRYWSNFVQSGNPNKPMAISPEWPVYDKDNENYLTLEKTMSADSAKEHLFTEEANFWLEVFPNLVDAVDRGKGGDGCDDFTSAAAEVVPNQSLIILTLLFGVTMSFHIFNLF